MGKQIIHDINGVPHEFEDPKWVCYILECNDKTFYTGVTTDIDRRLKEHNDDYRGRGAKYTKTRRPLRLVYLSGYFNTRGEVMQTESQIKSLTRKQKINLIQGESNRHSL